MAKIFALTVQLGKWRRTKTVTCTKAIVCINDVTSTCKILLSVGVTQ